MSDNIPARDEREFAEATIQKLRSHCPEGFDARVTIEGVRNGYAHTLYWGTCDPSVTRSDLAKLFAHPQFGSRNDLIWAENGVTKFSIIRHND